MACGPTSAPTVSDLFREPSHHADFLQHVDFVGLQVEAQIRWHLFGHSPEQDEVRVGTWTMDFERDGHEQNRSPIVPTCKVPLDVSHNTCSRTSWCSAASTMCFAVAFHFHFHFYGCLTYGCRLGLG